MDSWSSEVSCLFYYVHYSGVIVAVVATFIAISHIFFKKYVFSV